jgi:hypothetical protein
MANELLGSIQKDIAFATLASEDDSAVCKDDVMVDYAENYQTADQFETAVYTDGMGIKWNAADMPAGKAMGQYRSDFFPLGATPTITGGILNSIDSYSFFWDGSRVIRGPVRVAEAVQVTFSADGGVEDLDFRCAVGEALLQPIVFLNADGQSAPNYTGKTLKLEVFDLEDHKMFESIATISRTTYTGDTANFSLTANNTSFDEETGDLRNAVEPSTFQVRITNVTAGQRLTIGGLQLDPV